MLQINVKFNVKVLTLFSFDLIWNCWNLNPLFKKYRYWQISDSWFACFININSFMLQTSSVLFRIKDTLKAFDNFKNKQKSVWSNIFLYIKVCLFWKCIQYTIHWDQTKMFKKSLHIRLEVQDHHGFTFNLRFFKKSISVKL